MRIAAILVTLATASSIAAEPKDDLVKAELKKLEGSWQMVLEEKDGVSRQNLPDRWHIKGSRYAISFNASNLKSPTEYQISIDPSKKPKQIETRMELKGPDGKPFLGTPMVGIYEIDGDKLRICYEFYMHSDKPRGRPDSFSAPKGANRLLLIFKRVNQ
jgi:uncharacterized protein (TIGR03067 family)